MSFVRRLGCYTGNSWFWEQIPEFVSCNAFFRLQNASLQEKITSATDFVKHFTNETPKLHVFFVCFSTSVPVTFLKWRIKMSQITAFRHFYWKDLKNVAGWSQRPFTDLTFPKLNFSSQKLTLQMVLRKILIFFPLFRLCEIFESKIFCERIQRKKFSIPLWPQRLHTKAAKVKKVFTALQEILFSLTNCVHSCQPEKTWNRFCKISCFCPFHFWALRL